MNKKRSLEVHDIDLEHSWLDENDTSKKVCNVREVDYSELKTMNVTNPKKYLKLWYKKIKVFIEDEE